MMTAIKKHFGDFAALVAVFALAIGVAAYILVNQDARPTFPLIEESPTTIEAEFSDAQAVLPGQGQSVRVAGVQVGKIGSVELEDGLAVVSMDIEPEYPDLVRADASALLRPRTGLKDMFIELDPGTKEQPALEEGDRITVENTAPDIDPDEILSALDTDTRAYLKLLVTGLGKGLDNNGDDLREVLKRFEPLHRDLAAVQGAFADRREELAQLIHNYGILTQELGRQDEDLVRLVTASNDVFETLASVDADISRSIALLPGSLRTTESTLRKVDDLGQVLGPTLDDLRPAMRQLDEANREVLPLVREGTPIVRDEIRPFVRRARPYVNDLRPAAKDLAASLPDLTTSFGELNRFFNMLAFNPAGHAEADDTNPTTGNSGVGDNDDGQPNRGGESCTAGDCDDPRRDEGYLYWLGWVANNTVSLHSTSDAEGPIRRVAVSLNCQTVTNLILPNAGPLVGELPPEAQEILLGGGGQPGLVSVLTTACNEVLPNLGELPDLGLPGPLGAQNKGAGSAQARGAGEEETPGDEAPTPNTQEEAPAEPGALGEGLAPEAELKGEPAPDAPLETGEGDKGAAD